MKRVGGYLYHQVYRAVHATLITWHGWKWCQHYQNHLKVLRPSLGTWWLAPLVNCQVDDAPRVKTSKQMPQTRTGLLRLNLRIGMSFSEHLAHKILPQWRLWVNSKKTDFTLRAPCRVNDVITTAYHFLFVIEHAEHHILPSLHITLLEQCTGLVSMAWSGRGHWTSASPGPGLAEGPSALPGPSSDEGSFT